MRSFEILIKEFGQAINIPDLCFDQDGLCFMTIDDQWPLVLRRDEEGARLTLIGELADTLPDKPSHAWLLKAFSDALNPMTSHQPGLGFDKSGGKMIAYWHLAIDRLTVSTLQEKIAYFIEWQKSWVLESKHCLDQKDNESSPIVHLHNRS